MKFNWNDMVSSVKRNAETWGWTALIFVRDHIFILAAMFSLVVMEDKFTFLMLLVFAFYTKLAEIRDELQEWNYGAVSSNNVTINVRDTARIGLNEAAKEV